jgi:hypothetical protein
MKTAFYLLIIVGGLGYGSFRIWDFYASLAPDTATSEPADLVAFMLSDRFAKLSPEEQKRFIEESMKRYATMTDAQRAAIDSLIAERNKKDPKAMGEQMGRMWKNIVVTSAEDYVKIPPGPEREKWIDKEAARWKAMMPRDDGQRRRGETEEKRKQREEEEKGPMTQERQAKVLGFFQKEVYPRTTARERALVLTLIKDMAPRFKPKDDG